MTAYLDIRALASVFALGFGVFTMYGVSCQVREINRADALRKRAGTSGIALRIWTTRIPLFHSASGLLVRVRGLHSACEEISVLLEERGVPTTPRNVCAVVLFVDVIASVCVTLALSLPIALLCAFGNLVAMCACVMKGKEKRVARVREEIPETLRIMQSCFQAGLSLEQTFQQLSDSLQGDLGRSFENASRMLKTGRSIPEALEYLNKRSDSSELSFVVSALAVQHQTGGSMESVLDAAKKGVASEIDLKRTLRVQTAQARASYHVVLFVTMSLVAVLIWLSDDFFGQFVSSATGVAVLVIAIALQVMGILSIKRILRSQES